LVGFASIFAPESTKTIKPLSVGIIADCVGLFIPEIFCKIKYEAVKIAPVFPQETNASPFSCFNKFKEMFIDEFFFFLNERIGLSYIVTTSSALTISKSFTLLFKYSFIIFSFPTKTISIFNSSFANIAPSIISWGA